MMRDRTATKPRSKFGRCWQPRGDQARVRVLIQLDPVHGDVGKGPGAVVISQLQHAGRRTVDKLEGHLL